MSTISMCFGIIRMYCAPAKHELPHIYAYCQNYKAAMDIETGNVIDRATLNCKVS